MILFARRHRGHAVEGFGKRVLPIVHHLAMVATEEGSAAQAAGFVRFLAGLERLSLGFPPFRDVRQQGESGNYCTAWFMALVSVKSFSWWLARKA